MGIAVVAFPFLLRQTAPYGRHTTDKWGPMLSNKLGWIVQEAPSLLFVSYFFFAGTLHKTNASYFFWGLWALHYFNRSFIYPLRTKTAGKKIPLVIVCSAIAFNFCNGFVNGYWLGNFGGNFGDEYFTSARFIIGILVFMAGVIINHQSDNILLALRKPGETGYKIPQGGLFRYVSCPNLLGEIIEWFGFALMIGSPAAWSFALWTFVNLVPRALDHHRWYKQKFADYPIERTAIFPLVL